MAHRNYYFHPVRPPTAPSGQWGRVTAKWQTRTASGPREKQASTVCQSVSPSNCRDRRASDSRWQEVVYSTGGWRDSLELVKKFNHDPPTNIYLPGNWFSECVLVPPTPLGPVRILSLGKSSLGLGSWPWSQPAFHYHLKRIQLLAVGLMDRSWQT